MSEKTREARLVQIGTGDRSEKIRTYNFPQSRVTDHRIDFTSHNLPEILNGSLAELNSALSEAEQVLQLRLLSKGESENNTIGGADGKA